MFKSCISLFVTLILLEYDIDHETEENVDDEEYQPTDVHKINDDNISVAFDHVIKLQEILESGPTRLQLLFSKYIIYHSTGT